MDSSNSFKIMLAEDNVMNQKLMYFTLKRNGLDVTIVSDGTEAVSLSQSDFYDIIIMDVMMPKLDGYQATKQIRDIQKNSAVKSIIIGLTSNVYDSDRDKCLHMGMDHYMPKPFDITLFNSILKEHGLI